MPADLVPYVPTAADLRGHAEYLVRRAAALDPPVVTTDELVWVRSFGRTVPTSGLALPSASTRLAVRAVVEMFRRGRATAHEVAVAHAAVVWVAQWRVATDGADAWADVRAELLAILQRMAYDAHMHRGYATVPDEAETFGGRLARLRTRAGLTQVELAAALHTSESAVRSWEGERFYPQLARVHELCAALRCALSELLGPSGDYR